MLVLDQVSYSRNDVPVVCGVSLSVGDGAALLLEGPNGSGKSTMIGLICGLLRPDEGRISWDGKSIHASDSGYRGSFTHVGHKYGLKADLTAEQNLAVHVGLFGGRPEVSPREAIERVGLADEADARCSRLSAGQLRRVSLARLLLCRMRLWLLDEPFANLDEDGAGLLRSLLAEHLDRKGMAVVSTHRPLRLDGLAVASHRLDA